MVVADWVAASAATVVTAIVTYVLAKLAKRSDARAQAETALNSQRDDHERPHHPDCNVALLRPGCG